MTAKDRAPRASLGGRLAWWGWRLIFTVLLVLCSLADARVVCAQARQSASVSSAAYEAAVKLGFEEFQLGNYVEARARFSEAHKLYPNARTLRALGMVEYELKRYVEAIRYLQDALASTERALTDEQRAQSERLLEQAMGYVAHYRFALTPANASVSIDGAPWRGCLARSAVGGGRACDRGERPESRKHAAQRAGARRRRRARACDPAARAAGGERAEPARGGASAGTGAQGLDLGDRGGGAARRRGRWARARLARQASGCARQPESYGALLRYIASFGFVVVAPNSRWVGSGAEQKRALEFIFNANEDSTSPYYHKLDTTKVAAAGHSQGGQGTVAVASDARISNVILFNSAGDNSASKPFLAVSGDRDLFLNSAAELKSAADAGSKSAWIWIHMVPGTGTGDGHLTVMQQPERLAPASVAWLKLLLSNDAASKQYFVGASCKLCGHNAEFEFGQKGLE